jgi:hypothetical protein
MTLHSLALARKPRSEIISAADGARAEAVDGGISFFDPAGRLLIRYEDGALTVRPPEGDLVLGSATGAVRIAAATDVVVDAQRDVVLHAPRKVELGANAGPRLTLDPKRAAMQAEEVVLRADRTRIEGGEAVVAADEIAMTAKKIVATAERWETVAAKAVLRTREMVHDVTGVLSQRLGRFRGVVREAYALRTGRTDLRSKEDTAIDGRRVLLG